MFIEHSSIREITSHKIIDAISTLQVVEINPIDLCNRTCSFCPRSSNAYKNKLTPIALPIIKKIANDLQEIAFNGRVSFVGFGEPLLYKQLPAAIEIIKNTVSDISCIEIITNADYLTVDKIEKIESAGCSHITVSMYDGDITNTITELFKNSNILVSLKHSYAGFTEINRKDILIKKEELFKNKPCYLPFYKMLIDTDGSVILCANDWNRSAVLGNVQNDSIKNIWLGERYLTYRLMLMQHNRDAEPCKYCNIDGTRYGEPSYTLWSKIVDK